MAASEKIILIIHVCNLFSGGDIVLPALSGRLLPSNTKSRHTTGQVFAPALPVGVEQ